MAKIRKRSLGSSRFAFLNRKRVRELYDEFSVASSLDERHDHDAGEIVLGVVSVFGEVASESVAVFVVLC